MISFPLEPYPLQRCSSVFDSLELYVEDIKTKLIYDVGLNDADYVVKPRIGGKIVRCPFYVTWTSMLKRCYSKKYQEKRPTYIGCSVCEEWLLFSNFKAWMTEQNWQGNELDKDIIKSGNKIYSPDTCVFVSSVTNSFLLDSAASRGEFLIGVCLDKRAGKCKAQCSNPFTREKEFLGYFDCPNLAHEAWRKRKYEFACQLADLQTDQRVASALRVRYLPKER